MIQRRFLLQAQLPANAWAAAWCILLLSVGGASAWYTHFPYTTQLQNHYYFLYYDGKGLEWNGARQKCIDDGGYLAVPNDAAELGLYIDIARKAGNNPWIGADWVQVCGPNDDLDAGKCRYELWWVAEAGQGVPSAGKRWFVGHSYFSSADEVYSAEEPNTRYRCYNGFSATRHDTKHAFLCEFEDPCADLLQLCPNGTKCVASAASSSYNCNCKRANDNNAVYCAASDFKFLSTYRSVLRLNGASLRYYNDGTGVTFGQAKQFCQSRGGTLNEIDSYSEMVAINNYLDGLDKQYVNEDSEVLVLWLGNRWYKLHDCPVHGGSSCYYKLVHASRVEQDDGTNVTTLTVQTQQFRDNPTTALTYQQATASASLQSTSLQYPFICKFFDVCNAEVNPCPAGTRCESTSSLKYDCICETENPDNSLYCSAPLFQNRITQRHTTAKGHSHMYYNDGTGASWSEARRVCQRDHGHLATINSDSEKAYIQAIIDDDGQMFVNDQAGLVWIGADWEIECGLNVTEHPNSCRYELKWVAGDEPRYVYADHLHAEYLSSATDYHIAFDKNDSSYSHQKSSNLYPFICESIDQPCSLGSNPCDAGETCRPAADSDTGFICGSWHLSQPCSSNPCQHGACANSPDHIHYTCICTGTGYAGETCATDVDECALPDACGGHGECTNSEGSHSCACESGFYGPTCEVAAVQDDTGTGSAEIDSGPATGVVAAGLCGLAVGSLMLVGAAYGLYNKVSTARRLTAEAVGDAGKVGQASQVGQASKVSQASKVGQAPSEPGRQPSVRSSTSQGSIATNATFESVGN